MKHRWLVLFALLLFALMGCRSAIGYTSTGGVYQINTTRGIWNLTGDVGPNSRAAIQWQAESELGAGLGTSVHYVDTSAAGPSPPRSSRDAVEEEGLRPFDPIAARAALSQVNVADCRAAAAAAQPRYGHAQVVFSPDGNVTKVIIDAPEGMNAAQVKCIGDHLGATKVALFKGSFVAMGTTFVM